MARQSKLYPHCITSVKEYCDQHGIDHIVQTTPKLFIRPDPFSMNRSTDSYMKYGGYLPIFEKENAFDYLDQYDQIAIIDADIYIRPDSPNIFEEFGTSVAWGGVCEREMNIQDWYKNKINNYSNMQYGMSHGKNGMDFKPNELGFEFFNMGLILMNSSLIKPYLKGQTAKQFIERPEFKDFVDGKGTWKWSTDQTLLNTWLKKENIPVVHMQPKWNGLFTAINNLKECHFIHFFLKDKLPEHGENVEELMKLI